MTFSQKNDLTPKLKELSNAIADCAKKAGLDFYDTIFELVDHEKLNAMAAYHGFPNRYPHWRWGMEFDRLKKSYRYGLSVIYELVINTDPSYAYLMKSNPLYVQKTVMAHVYAHVDFFKNNYWFSPTNRKMLDQMATHASIVRKIMNKYGIDQVEKFIDHCLSLDNLIDIHQPLNTKSSTGIEKYNNNNKNHYFSYEESDQLEFDDDVNQDKAKISSKKYMDSYVNPKKRKNKDNIKKPEKKPINRPFPSKPQRDVLLFLINHAPLRNWQKRILEIIRDEAYYFVPQGQTKILNEGWASYWHSKIMTELYPVKDSEIIGFCDLHSSVVAENPKGGVNPYRLGIELLKYAEKKDKEKTKKNDLNLNKLKSLTNNQTKNKINKEANNKSNKNILDIKAKYPFCQSKIFEIRKWHNDITFIDEFLDEEFCHENKLFLYQYDPIKKKKVITSKDFKPIKKQLLDSITNLGQPIIELIDANYKNRGELLMEHKFTGKELKKSQITQTLKSLYALWTRPVHITTQINGKSQKFSFESDKDDTSSQKSKSSLNLVS